MGASKADGKYLFFTTDDAVPSETDLFYQMVKILENDSKIAVVSGRQIPGENSDPIHRIITKNHYNELGIKEDRVVEVENFDDLPKDEKRMIAQTDDVCNCYRKEVFSKFKYHEIDHAEDLELGTRLLRNGYKIAQLSSRGVIHSHRKPADYYLKRNYLDVLELAKLFGTDYLDYSKTKSVTDLSQFILPIYHSLCLALDQIMINRSTREVSKVFIDIKILIKKFYNSTSTPKTNDNSLEKVFEKLFKVEKSSQKTIKFQKNTLLFYYFKVLNNFKNSFKQELLTNENADDIFESFFKIFGLVVGDYLAKYVLFNQRLGENKDFQIVHYILNF